MTDSSHEQRPPWPPGRPGRRQAPAGASGPATIEPWDTSKPLWPPGVERTFQRFEMLFQMWPRPARPPSALLLTAALGAGLVGAVALGDVIETGAVGIGIFITALAVVIAVLPDAWSAERVIKGRRLNGTGAGFAVLGLTLAGMTAIRDAPWLAALCLTLLVPVMSYAFTGGRSWWEVLGGGVSLPVAGVRMLPWAGRGAAGMVLARRHRTWPIARTALIAGLLLAVFGGLFAAADAAFREFFGGLTPEVSTGPTLLRASLGFVTVLVVLAAAFLLLSPPPLRVLAPTAARPAGRWAWAVPIAVLDVLFMSFCALQAVVLLATDRDRILRATGLTYAEYARQGFFQLVVVTVLVLAVLAVAVRYAPRETARDRLLVRALLGTLCALTLVIVAVALRRLYLYEEAFGWTRLRLWVHAFELWLAVVVVLIAAAGFRLRSGWLPRAVAAGGAAGLIGLGVLNPDGFIAEQNIARYEKTNKIDLDYVSGLSADAVPALDRLPEPQRSCALREIANRLDRGEALLGANQARHRAREILAKRPPAAC